MGCLPHGYSHCPGKNMMPKDFVQVICKINNKCLKQKVLKSMSLCIVQSLTFPPLPLSLPHRVSALDCYLVVCREQNILAVSSGTRLWVGCLRCCPDDLALIVAAVTAQVPRIFSSFLFLLTLGVGYLAWMCFFVGFGAEKGLF